MTKTPGWDRNHETRRAALRCTNEEIGRVLAITVDVVVLQGPSQRDVHGCIRSNIFIYAFDPAPTMSENVSC